MKKIWDIAVIGGGAAGLAAAIEAKRTAKTLSVPLLEKERKSREGSWAATGNGRCNLSNRACAEQETVLRFFAEAGIAVREEDGRLYPYNEDARGGRGGADGPGAASGRGNTNESGNTKHGNPSAWRFPSFRYRKRCACLRTQGADRDRRQILRTVWQYRGRLSVCANARTQDRDAGAGADGHRDGRGCVFAERCACQGDSRAVLRRQTLRAGSRGGTVSHRRLVRYLCNELIGACQTTEAGRAQHTGSISRLSAGARSDAGL